MRAYVSKTRYISTLISEKDLDIDINNNKLRLKDGKELNIYKLSDNIEQYLISMSAYIILMLLILLIGLPVNFMELIGFVLGVIAIVISFEKIPFAVTVVAGILVVPTIISIIMPAYSFLSYLSSGFISGVGVGFFGYLLVFFYMNGFFTTEKDIFAIDRELKWKTKI